MLREPVAPPIVYPEDGSVRPVTRLVWRPAPTPPTSGRRLEELSGRRVLILGDAGESERLGECLRRYGAEALTGVPEHLLADDAVDALTAALGSIDGVIDLNVGESWAGTEADAWRKPLHRTVAVLKSCYGEWIRETDCRRRFYIAVTSLGGTLGYGAEPIPQPLGGIWLGLAKTVPRELPNCNVKVIDLAPAERGALEDILLDELYQWGLFEVGYAGGRRYMFVGHAEDAPPPQIALDSEDTILISGGSRGIGFALAQGLAGEFGCRIVVTGRNPLPDAAEPWLELDEAAYKAYELSVLKSPLPGQTVADARRGLERIRQAREQVANLDAARTAGLPIEYLACDFNDPAQVRELLDQIGPSLRGVVHNASVSAPTRLPGKTTESFFATIQTKVGVFFDLFEAVSDRPLKFFCNVGSLVGRWGGMIGEIDYAAANAGLAIAGAWANRRAAFPVMTVSWPTWEKLGGMIKNFDVTLNYTSALHVDEGVYRWKRELLGAAPGETVFVGTVGKAVFPVHVKGFPPSPDLPNIGQLYSYLHYLGEARRFQPFHSIESESTVSADDAPGLNDFRVAGSAALPVSMLLEYMLSVGEWVQPEPPAQLQWRELRELHVDLNALPAPTGVLTFVKRGRGQWIESTWIVDVEIGVEAPNGMRDLARARLVYSADAPAVGPELGLDESGETIGLATHPGVLWSGSVYRAALWRRNPDGTIVGQVRLTEPSDIWATSFVPEAALPAGHLENIFQAALVQGRSDAPAGALRLERMERFATVGGWGAVTCSPATNAWSVLSDGGRTALRLEGLAYA
jgi:NAD(P)-dependent dehydrogenase (short-subunit alcohol dehydrogenase family)